MTLRSKCIDSTNAPPRPAVAQHLTFHVSFITLRNCYVAESENWHNSGNQKMFCVDCYAFLPKYDDERGTDEAVEPPPFMFRPVKSETDWKHTLPVSILGQGCSFTW